MPALIFEDTVRVEFQKFCMQTASTERGQAPVLSAMIVNLFGNSVH
jgi:hypothetical protein